MAATNRAASTFRLANTAARYREARQALRTPSSWQSRYGLDWTNFFLADVQTGFGTFVAFYLADLGWSKSSVGLALTTGTLASVVIQVPGGALADAVRCKRALVGAGIVMIAAAAVIFAFAPSVIPVICAELLHGATGGIVTPAIGAISLGIVGDCVAVPGQAAGERQVFGMAREVARIDSLVSTGGAHCRPAAA